MGILTHTTVKRNNTPPITMKKTLLLVLLALVAVSASLKLVGYSESEDCTGASVSEDIPTDCQTVDGVDGSVQVSVDGDTITSSSYESDDCSGEAVASVDSPCDECVGAGGVSFEYQCSGATAVPQLVLGAVAVAAIALVL